MPGAENAPQDPQLLPPPRLPDARSSLPPDCREENSIIVTLATFPRDSTQTFRFTGDVEGTISRDGASLCRTGLEAPETYSVTQTLPDGWIIRSIQCDERQSTGDIESATATFDLDLGEIVECTFYVQESSTETCHEVVGRWPYGRTYAVAVDGTTAYIGNGASLQVLDVSDPRDPLPLGDVYVNGQVRVIEASGEFVYLAIGDYWGEYRSLVVVDVRDRACPTVAGVHPDVDRLWNIEINGSTAYAAAGYAGFKIIDVSDPSMPTTTGSLEGEGPAIDMEIVNGIAFASFYEAFSVIDVRNPDFPRVIGHMNSLALEGFKVSVCRNTAFVAAYYGGFHTIDLSNPTAPTIMGGGWTQGKPKDIEIIEQHLYLANSDLEVFDVSNPAMPVLVGRVDLQGEALGISISRGFGFVATGSPDSGLSVVNVFDPSHPREIGTYTTPLEATDVAISNGFAFLGHGRNGGVRILDISRPGISTEVGFITTSRSDAVAAVGSLVCVAAGHPGLHFFDVSQPEAPIFLGAVNTPGFAQDVVIRGDLAYVADAGYGLSVVDISEPRTPSVVGTCQSPRFPEFIAIDGNLAFVAQKRGLAVIDVSDSARPVLLSKIARMWEVYGVAVCGHHVCLSERYQGLLIFDVTDPSTPIQVATYDLGFAPGPLVSHNGLVYVQAYPNLQIIDISDPRRPFSVGSNTAGEGGPMASGDGIVAVAGGLTGFKVVAPCGGGSN